MSKREPIIRYGEVEKGPRGGDLFTVPGHGLPENRTVYEKGTDFFFPGSKKLDVTFDETKGKFKK